MIRGPHVLTVRLNEDEWHLWSHLVEKNRCSTQDMLHAIIVDALIDEGYNGLRCGEPEGRPDTGETSEAGDTAEEGSDPGDNERSCRPEVGPRVSRAVPCVQHELFGRGAEDELHGGAEGSSNLGFNGHNVSLP